MLKQWSLYLLILLACISAHAQTNDSLPLPKADSIYQKQLHDLDSVQQNTKKQYNKLKGEYDSVQQHMDGSIAKLQLKSDSLKKFNLPTDSYTRKIDSLTQRKDSRLSALKSRTDSLKQGSINKISTLKLPPEIEKQSQQFTSQLNKLDIALPNADVKNFPSIPSLGTSGNSLPEINAPTPDISVPTTDTSIPQTGSIKTPDALNDAKQITDQAKEITGKQKKLLIK